MYTNRNNLIYLFCIVCVGIRKNQKKETENQQQKNAKIEILSRKVQENINKRRNKNIFKNYCEQTMKHKTKKKQKQGKDTKTLKNQQKQQQTNQSKFKQNPKQQKSTETINNNNKNHFKTTNCYYFYYSYYFFYSCKFFIPPTLTDKFQRYIASMRTLLYTNTHTHIKTRTYT